MAADGGGFIQMITKHFSGYCNSHYLLRQLIVVPEVVVTEDGFYKTFFFSYLPFQFYFWQIQEDGTNNPISKSTIFFF